MGEVIYNKLIRDRIPEIIENSNKKAIVEVADGEVLLSLLNQKLLEELNEYNESSDMEELADLVEVVYAILDYKGITREEFDLIRKEKNEKRGSFTKGLVLLKVTER